MPPTLEDAFDTLALEAKPLSKEDESQLYKVICQKPTAKWKLITHQLRNGDVLKGPLNSSEHRHRAAIVLSISRSKVMKELGDQIVLVPELCKTEESYFIRVKGINPNCNPENWKTDDHILNTHNNLQVKVLDRASTGVIQLSYADRDRLKPHTENILWHLMCRFLLNVADSGFWNMICDETYQHVAGIDLEEERGPYQPLDFWQCLCVTRFRPIYKLACKADLAVFDSLHQRLNEINVNTVQQMIPDYAFLGRLNLLKKMLPTPPLPPPLQVFRERIGAKRQKVNRKITKSMWESTTQGYALVDWELVKLSDIPPGYRNISFGQQEPFHQIYYSSKSVLQEVLHSIVKPAAWKKRLSVRAIKSDGSIVKCAEKDELANIDLAGLIAITRGPTNLYANQLIVASNNSFLARRSNKELQWITIE